MCVCVGGGGGGTNCTKFGITAKLCCEQHCHGGEVVHVDTICPLRQKLHNI